MNLAELLTRTSFDVPEHIERTTTVPVVDGLQAQGDLIVVPLSFLGRTFHHAPGLLRAVPAEGVELVRGLAGNNPHTLLADENTARWGPAFQDRLGLGVAVVENTAPVYLVHPEHGGSGIAPGRWLVRRQRERGTGFKRTVLVAD